MEFAKLNLGFPNFEITEQLWLKNKLWKGSPRITANHTYSFHHEETKS